MTKVVVRDAFSDQLHALHAPVELCDESGHVLGQFIPTFGISPEQLAADGCPYSVEELLKAKRETGGRTLAEIWRDLGQA